MTWHPTTNRIQFCHLTKEEQDALQAWPHGWEYSNEPFAWKGCLSPAWVSYIIYRGKPAPVVTSVWFNCYNHSMTGPHVRRAQADRYEAKGRIDVLRIDTCNGVSTAHLEGLE